MSYKSDNWYEIPNYSYDPLEKDSYNSEDDMYYEKAYSSNSSCDECEYYDVLCDAADILKHKVIGFSVHESIKKLRDSGWTDDRLFEFLNCLYKRESQRYINDPVCRNLKIHYKRVSPISQMENIEKLINKYQTIIHDL
jgi:hypothetical protein